VTTAGPIIIGVLTHTRPYVWAIFAFIIFMGFQRTRDRTVQLWRLFLLPTIMILTALSGMIGAGLGSLPAILAGLAVGGVSGWLLERDGATRRLPNGQVWLRGEWWSFVQILLIFGFRYSLAVVGAINPTFVADPTVHLVAMFVSSLLSAMVLAKAFRQKSVRGRPWASMVFLSSVSGLAGFSGLTAYGATKAGIAGLTRGLAEELARESIRVNCVAPSWVFTDMTDASHAFLSPEQMEAIQKQSMIGPGTPRDVSHAIAFLLSDAARWITGLTLPVDGGHISR